MARFRCWGMTLVALALVVQSGRSEGKKLMPRLEGAPAYVEGSAWAVSLQPAAADPQTCVIYSLADLGADPEFGTWIAATIPEVVAPGSWNKPAVCGLAGKNQVLRYYGPKRILVVYHTPAVQAQVAAFLKDLKKSASPEKDRSFRAGKPTGRHTGVVRAQYEVPSPVPPTPAAREARFTYPLPPPARPPKHLFHFIIRYEGAGIIDSNVIKYMKIQNEQSSAAEAEADKKEKADKAVPRVPAAAPPADKKEDKKEKPDPKS